MKALAEQIADLDSVEITVFRGQRIGIFSGSGVGKSVLLSMLPRNVSADISVIGLVGERGREVQEFLRDDLGPAGLVRWVVVGPLLRTCADAPAGGSARSGCPPASRRPPRAIPRPCSPNCRACSSGLGPAPSRAPSPVSSALMDGDDHNEPVADAVRGILDGHIVMERAIAERGRYPAINVLKSISRTMPRAADPAFLPAINRARQVMALYSDMEELIRLGLTGPGQRGYVDEAIALHKPLEAFLSQLKEEATSMAEEYRQLEQILQAKETEN